MSLDAVDVAIVAALRADARQTNKALAERAGIAPSTCVARVRALEAAGVLRGYHADVDLRRLGRDHQALVAVRLQPRGRARLEALARELRDVDGVLEVFCLAGEDDLVVHVATAGTAQLRRLVAERLGRHPAVARTATSLVLEHVRAV